MYIISTAIADV